MLILALFGSVIFAAWLFLLCLMNGDFTALPGIAIGGIALFGLLQARLALFVWWNRGRRC